MTFDEFQTLIEKTYFEKDSKRGVPGTFCWFVEEVGELCRAIHRERDDRKNLHAEFADVMAWLSTLASLCDVKLEEAIDKYRNGCPTCQQIPCTCPEKGSSG